MNLKVNVVLLFLLITASFLDANTLVVNFFDNYYVFKYKDLIIGLTTLGLAINLILIIFKKIKKSAN